MKILSVKRDRDFVRFSYNLDIEESPGLIITVCACGSMEYLEGEGIDNYSAPCIDDIDWNKIQFLGKIVDYKGFKELYNKLFKEDFTKFEARVDDAASDAIHQQIKGSIIGADTELLMSLFRTRYRQVVYKLGKVHDTTYSDDWTLLAISRELGYTAFITKEYTDYKGEKAKYDRRCISMGMIAEILA